MFQSPLLGVSLANLKHLNKISNQLSGDDFIYAASILCGELKVSESLYNTYIELIKAGLGASFLFNIFEQCIMQYDDAEDRFNAALRDIRSGKSPAVSVFDNFPFYDKFMGPLYRHILIEYYDHYITCDPKLRTSDQSAGSGLTRGIRTQAIIKHQLSGGDKVILNVFKSMPNIFNRLTKYDGSFVLNSPSFAENFHIYRTVRETCEFILELPEANRSLFADEYNFFVVNAIIGRINKTRKNCGKRFLRAMFRKGALNSRGEMDQTLKFVKKWENDLHEYEYSSQFAKDAIKFVSKYRGYLSQSIERPSFNSYWDGSAIIRKALSNFTPIEGYLPAAHRGDDL